MYGVLPYYLTKAAVEIPYQLLMPILFSLITYWSIGFRNTVKAYFTHLACLLVLVFLGNSLGVMLSSMFSDVRTAFSIAPVIMMPLMLFSGFMSNVDSIVKWLSWLQYISPVRYSMEIFLRVEYRREDFYNDNNELKAGNNGYPVESYNYNLGLSWCFGIIMFIAVAARILAYVFLKVQTLGV
jgi:ABC-type multidrug transport system permease subunit